MQRKRHCAVAKESHSGPFRVYDAGSLTLMFPFSPAYAAVRRIPAPESYQTIGPFQPSKEGSSIEKNSSGGQHQPHDKRSGTRVVGPRSRPASQSAPCRKRSMHFVLAAAKQFGTWDAPRCTWAAAMAGAHLWPTLVPPPEFRVSLPNSTTSSNFKDFCSGRQSPIRALVSATTIGMWSMVPCHELVSNKLSGSLPNATDT